MKSPDPRFGLDKIYIAGADGVVRSAKCFAGPTTPARQLSIKLSRTPPLRGGECSVLIQQQWLQFRSSVLHWQVFQPARACLPEHSHRNTSREVSGASAGETYL